MACLYLLFMLDEIQYLHELFEHKNAKALDTYIRGAPYRKWHALGMEIEPDVVVKEAARLLTLLKV